MAETDLIRLRDMTIANYEAFEAKCESSKSSDGPPDQVAVLHGIVHQAEQIARCTPKTVEEVRLWPRRLCAVGERQERRARRGG
jgi:hypothetical protein